MCARCVKNKITFNQCARGGKFPFASCQLLQIRRPKINWLFHDWPNSFPRESWNPMICWCIAPNLRNDNAIFSLIETWPFVPFHLLQRFLFSFSVNGWKVNYSFFCLFVFLIVATFRLIRWLYFYIQDNFGVFFNRLKWCWKNNIKSVPTGPKVTGLKGLYTLMCNE